MARAPKSGKRFEGEEKEGKAKRVNRYGESKHSVPFGTYCRSLLAAFTICILLGLGGCGGSGEPRSYSVQVFNYTDAPITVRYNWTEVFWIFTWIGEETIPVNDNAVLDWGSDDFGSEWIEVLYQGKKRQYIVAQFDTVQVFVQDFP